MYSSCIIPYSLTRSTRSIYLKHTIINHSCLNVLLERFLVKIHRSVSFVKSTTNREPRTIIWNKQTLQLLLYKRPAELESVRISTKFQCEMQHVLCYYGCTWSSTRAIKGIWIMQRSCETRILFGCTWLHSETWSFRERINV